MDIILSNHALKQMQKQAITETMILAAWHFGERIYAKNSLYYFLGKRAVNRLLKILKLENPDKWEGITLVCDPKTKRIITVFKNRNWLNKIRYF